MKTKVEALMSLAEKLGAQEDATPQTVVDALKVIYETLGGEENLNGVQTIAEMIQAVASVAEAGITPEGTIRITENGTVDVTEYAEAEVDVPGTGKVWPLNVKAIGGTVYIENPAYFEVGGNYSISPGEQSYGVTTSPLTPDGVNINCKALKTSYPGFSGSFLLDFLVVEAPNQKRIAVGETNCTVIVVAEGLSEQYNKNTIVVKVDGRKSNTVVANPYVTFVISDPS